MTSERSGTFAMLSMVAWMAMLGVIALWAIFSWYLPGRRDPDVSSALEMSLTFVVIMALPMAAMAAALLAPSAWTLDRWIGGRFTRPVNAGLGVALSIPASVAYLVGDWLIFGSRGRSFPSYLDNIQRSPQSMFVLALAFAVGGVIVSAGIRRRT